MILSSFLPSANTLLVPANQVFFTASQTSTAKAGSVWEKVSGEYSNRKLVPCYVDRQSEVDFRVSTVEYRAERERRVVWWTHLGGVLLGEFPDELGVLGCKAAAASRRISIPSRLQRFHLHRLTRPSWPDRH